MPTNVTRDELQELIARRAMPTPSLVLAYWMRGSMAQPFYDMAGLGCLRLHHEPRKAHQA